MTYIGEVVRLAWPTVTGLITLVAVTTHHEKLAEVECEPADEVRVTETLYRELWHHAHSITPASSATGPGQARPPLRLVASA